MNGEKQMFTLFTLQVIITHSAKSSLYLLASLTNLEVYFTTLSCRLETTPPKDAEIADLILNIN